jgi:hypothetical protein
VNEAKLTARKLQFSRLGMFPVGLTRKELQREWEKLREEGKLPALTRGRRPGDPRVPSTRKPWKRRKKTRRDGIT